VAGTSQTASGDEHAFLWQDGEMTDLGTLGGATSAVGEGSGVIGLLWPGFIGAVNDRQAFNEAGQVAGTSQTASGDEHAFLWQDGEMTDLGTLGGSSSSAYAVNNRGQVVGVSETASGEQHAFLWQDGEMTDLGALAGEGLATDINDHGQIVGAAGDLGAVLWTIS
jgi:probable HAF family extracellular repeat protein